MIYHEIIYKIYIKRNTKLKQYDEMIVQIDLCIIIKTDKNQ